VLPLAAPGELAALIDRVAQRGDLVVCLGAGNITQWAQALPAELAARRRRAVGGAR
jgi:UDP-N-acetylmuramate--alanine ligase